MYGYPESPRWCFEQPDSHVTPWAKCCSTCCHLLLSLVHSRSILEEYCEISSLLTDDIVKVHQEISAAVQQIDPVAEYQPFIDAYRWNVALQPLRRCFLCPRCVNSVRLCLRSPETPETNVEFDTSLLEDTDNLPANDILWNTLTADSLQTMWAPSK